MSILYEKHAIISLSLVREILLLIKLLTATKYFVIIVTKGRIIEG